MTSTLLHCPPFRQVSTPRIPCVPRSGAARSTVVARTDADRRRVERSGGLQACRRAPTGTGADAPSPTPRPRPPSVRDRSRSPAQPTTCPHTPNVSGMSRPLGARPRPLPSVQDPSRSPAQATTCAHTPNVSACLPTRRPPRAPRRACEIRHARRAQPTTPPHSPNVSGVSCPLDVRAERCRALRSHDTPPVDAPVARHAAGAGGERQVVRREAPPRPRPTGTRP